MRIVRGPNGNDSRTAFLIAPDLPRESVEPTRLRAGAWCSLILSIAWVVVLVGFALITSTWTPSTGEEEPIAAGGLYMLVIVPLYGLVFSARLLRSTDDVAAYIALWPLHVFAIPVNFAIAIESPYFLPSLVLNVATLAGFVLEKRWWDRF